MLGELCRLRLLAGVIDRGSEILPGLESAARAALARPGRQPKRMQRAGMLCALRMRRFNDLVRAAHVMHYRLLAGQSALVARDPGWTWSDQGDAKMAFLDMMLAAQQQLDSLARLMPKICLFG
jgi:hypothetical protein